MSWKNKKIALVQGGDSLEKDISYKTASAVEQALTELSCPYFKVEADRNIFETLKKEQPDRVFIATHGPFGEDGCLQGICEFLKLPYTGSGVLTSAMCMDKFHFKKILIQNQIPTPHFTLVEDNFDYASVKQYPVVVKASHGGSSLGTYLVFEPKDLVPSIEKARKIGRYVFIEDYIPEAREVASPWLEKNILSFVEIFPEARHYDYKSKYTSQKTKYQTPAKLNDVLKQKVLQLSEKSFSLFEIRGYARLDFIIDKNNQPWVLELNTLPGLTDHSLLPMSAQHSNISFTKLIEKILNQATTDYKL